MDLPSGSENDGDQTSRPGRCRTRARRVVAALTLLGLLAVLASVLAVRPLWRTTPAGIQPPVKVSLLDLLQVRSLAASARRLAAAGQSGDSLRAWTQAIANNQGDVNLWRETLNHLATSPRIDLPLVRPILANLSWFVTLTQTNQTDFLRAARVCERYGDHERLLMLPAPSAVDDLVKIQSVRMQALFQLGRMHEFVPLFEQHEKALEALPDFDLYRHAYLAGWGDAEVQSVALRRLQAAAENPETARLASRLELIVANRLADADAAVRALSQREAIQATTGLDHALTWLANLSAGDRAGAIAMATQYRGVPESANELNVMSSAYLALGLVQKCGESLQEFAPVYGRNRSPESANLWMTFAALLERNRDWEGMRRLSGLLQSLPGEQDWLDGFATYLDGFAAYKLTQTPLSETRFREALKAGFPVGSLGIAAANGLLQLDLPERAEEVLRSVERALQHTPPYWTAVWNTALRLHRDDTRLLEAATRLHGFEPGDVAAQFNLAAALMIRRERPAEALGLLWNLRQSSAGSLYIELNYALALAQNARHAEAAQLLRALNPAALTDTEKPTYHLGMLKILQQAGSHEEAREILKEIDRSRLFPSQLRWLEDIESAMKAAP